MKLLRKLPNSVREAPGGEWIILKKLPVTLFVGTLFPLVISLSNRFYWREEATAQIAKHAKIVDIISIATAVTVWTAVFTVAIGCSLVIVIKGPGYVADAYELVDSERPGAR